MKILYLFFSLFLSMTVFAQQVGSKVIFKAVDGSYYTGAITEIKGDQYKVRYDNTDFDAWMSSSQVTVAGNPATYTSYNNQDNKATNNTTVTTNQKTTTTKTTPNTGNRPTETDITKYMKSVWEREKSTSSPRTTITINSITLGSSAKATLTEVYEGIPENGMVTAAKIDFTEYTYYTDKTKETRRLMTASVYRDKFGEWSVMNIGTKYILQ